MKAGLKNIGIVKALLLFFVLFPLMAHAQTDPQELRQQACERLFEIIIQCQLSTETPESDCGEVSGILSSPQTKELLSQRKPDGATDTLVDQTLKQVTDMCRAACESAKRGKLYKTAQDWIDSGGCTIQVTR
jgi:ABC-type transporter MlaC component